MTMTDQPSTVSIKDLAVRYPVGGSMMGGREYLSAVDGVSLEIPKGSFFGLVGESGCGKTTLGRATLNAAPVSAGSVTFQGASGSSLEVGGLKGEQLRQFQRQAQMIFQDPYAALSPRMTVRDIIAEPLEIMKITKSRKETDERVREIAKRCRLNLEHLRRFPHAFSGGQRQRISIARALAMNPNYIVADESVAALDVSTQADILNLMRELQKTLDLTVLFISHDLSVVAHVCDMVAVMYLGKIVEIAPPAELFRAPQHPYSKALIGSVPKLDPRKRGKRAKLKGEIPSPMHPPSGCRFHTRCPHAQDRCKTDVPTLKNLPGGTSVACHFHEDLSAPTAPAREVENA